MITFSFINKNLMLCCRTTAGHDPIDALELDDGIAPDHHLSQVLSVFVALALFQHHVQERIVPAQRPHNVPLPVQRDLEALVL